MNLVTLAIFKVGWGAVPAAYGGHFGGYGGGGGIGEVGRVIAHAAIWTTVSQILRTQPVLVMVTVALIAAVWLMSRRRRRYGRPARASEAARRPRYADRDPLAPPDLTWRQRVSGRR